MEREGALETPEVMECMGLLKGDAGQGIFSDGMVSTTKRTQKALCFRKTGHGVDKSVSTCKVQRGDV